MERWGSHLDPTRLFKVACARSRLILSLNVPSLQRSKSAPPSPSSAPILSSWNQAGVLERLSTQRTDFLIFVVVKDSDISGSGANTTFPTSGKPGVSVSGVRVGIRFLLSLLISSAAGPRTPFPREVRAWSLASFVVSVLQVPEVDARATVVLATPWGPDPGRNVLAAQEANCDPRARLLRGPDWYQRVAAVGGGSPWVPSSQEKRVPSL